jgi:hypothetical protein
VAPNGVADAVAKQIQIIGFGEDRLTEGARGVAALGRLGNEED